MQDLNDALREISKKHGWSQSELAEKFGVSQPTISRIMRGLPVRSGPAIKKISQALKAADRAQHVMSNLEGEYSSIHVDPNRSEVILRRPHRHSKNEVKALDKLLDAIEEYVVARSQSGN